MINRLKSKEKLEDEYINNAGRFLSRKINEKQNALLDFVKDLDSVLTNGDHDVRLRGLNLLTAVITNLANDILSEKEIITITEFLHLRIADHKSMHSPVLRCLSYFFACDNKPPTFSQALLKLLKNDVNVQSMSNENRYLVYELLRRIVVERHGKSASADSDIVYSVVHIIEGESNPQNLITCFGIVSYILKNFSDLEPYIDDLFEWLSSYYPIDYTPSDNLGNVLITREDLVSALYECFYASHLNSENLQTLLLEKLESNSTAIKLETLECLIKCYDRFPLKTIKDYATSLWTCVRMDCLREIKSVNTKLLDANYRALAAMTTKLAEDDELFFRFVDDLCEEMNIAIKKLEVGLFEPAVRLLAQAAKPRLRGFNVVLRKILPASLEALRAGDFRSLSGLVYVFDALLSAHPNERLSEDLTGDLEALAILVADRLPQDPNCLCLFTELIRLRVPLQTSPIKRIVAVLMEYWPANPSVRVEECLVHIMRCYDAEDIVMGEQREEVRLEKLYQSADIFEDCESSATNLRKLVALRQAIVRSESDGPHCQSVLEQSFKTSYVGVSKVCRHIVASHAHLLALHVNKLDDARLKPFVLGFCSSEFCSNLMSADATLAQILHLPIVQSTLKSLAVRNDPMSVPLTNLLLNFVESSRVDLAHIASRGFACVHDDKLLYSGGPTIEFDRAKGFRVFALYKNKFYAQSSKEIKIRYAKSDDRVRKLILLSCVASQTIMLPASIYKRDYEWILRESLKALSEYKNSLLNDGKTGPQVDDSQQDIIGHLFECFEHLIDFDMISEELTSLLDSIVRLNLSLAKLSPTMHARRKALDCLRKIASTFKDGSLLNIRAEVVSELKPCLSDRKRIVRQAAAEARLRWTLVGQPIDSR